MPSYQIVLTKPDDSLVSTQAPAAPNVWDEFLAIQLSPATAINCKRIHNWLNGLPQTTTRTSQFVKLMERSVG